MGKRQVGVVSITPDLRTRKKNPKKDKGQREKRYKAERFINYGLKRNCLFSRSKLFFIQPNTRRGNE